MSCSLRISSHETYCGTTAWLQRRLGLRGELFRYYLGGQASSTYRSRGAFGASDRQAQGLLDEVSLTCANLPRHAQHIDTRDSHLGSSASLSQLLRPRGDTFVPQHRAASRRGISLCTLLQASPPPISTSHTPPRRQSPAHTAFLTSDGLFLRPANQCAHRSELLNGQPNGLTSGSSRGA